MALQKITIALAGNPNSGKTTIFNILTGTRQKVGNWPGVTVEKKEGNISRDGCDVRIVDLPGTYSLTPLSIEEIIARDFVLEENPDVVIAIIDASNLERSLYLATQLREIDCKVIFALNMADLARSRGIKIDAGKLSNLLNLPVVFTVGVKNEGIDTLLKTAIELAQSDYDIPQERKVKYSQDIENAVAELELLLTEACKEALPYNPRWTAIKLLEDDKVVTARIRQKLTQAAEMILKKTASLRRHLIDRFDEDPEIVMTDERYGFIAGIIKEVLTTSTRTRIDTSRNVDLILTNRFVGFPIFIFFIWMMFQATFTFGTYPMDWIESGVNLLSSSLGRLLPASLLKALLLDGIVAGIGSVIIGIGSVIIGIGSIAIGIGSIAIGIGSIAIGIGSVIIGIGSIAIGIIT